MSPDTLVCCVLGDDPSAPLVEYRGLGVGDFGFPATGTDLVADSLQRDFTVNSILYDVERHLVIDASERGLEDWRCRDARWCPSTRRPIRWSRHPWLCEP